jgi:hypothetical protein
MRTRYLIIRKISEKRAITRVYVFLFLIFWLQLGKRWAEMNYQCCQHAKTIVANQRRQLFIGWMVYGYTLLFYSYKIKMAMNEGVLV